MRNVKNYILLLVFFGSISVCFFSCSKDKFQSDIPSYIAINDITLSTSYVTEGTSSEKITDAWVYLNDNLIGVYELPARIPVLKEGSFNLKVYAGIKENGIAGTRSRYLFYNPHEEQVTLQRDKVLEVKPQLTYVSNANFIWFEDFENASVSFTYTSGSDTILNKVNTNVFEGSASGKVLLTTSMDFFEMQSPAFTTLPKNGNPIYMELNFITNEPILLALYADTEQLGLIYLNTSTDWNKIYVNFTDIVNSRPNASSYKISFGFKNTSSSPFGVDYPEFYIDNIKLVYL